MHWLRRSFIAGFFVVVPLFISVAAFIWVFGVVDGLTTPLYDRVIGRRIPGLGTLTTAAAIVLVGAFARNVIGRRVLQRGEAWLLRVPGFRTIYAPVKQLIAAFSPDNESGFKRVVMVEDAKRGFVLGFLTREFTIDRGKRTRGAARGLRADESSLPGRHRHRRARARDVSGHHRRGRHPDFLDRRHGASNPAAHIIPPFARGSMIVTVQTLLQRLTIPVLGLVLCGTILAAAASARRGAAGAGRDPDGGAGARRRRGQSGAAGPLDGRLPRHQRPDAADGRAGDLRARPAVRPDDVHAAARTCRCTRRCSRCRS